MAVPAATFQTHQQIGRRESLSDVIYNIAPTDTPFMTSIRRGSAKAVFEEWQTDTLATAAGDNAVIEGDDATTNTATPTVRLGNYVQLSDKVVRVTSTADAVDTAGRRKELSYQIAKRGKELKRDMETNMTGNYASSAGSAGAARTSAGFEAWITTNDNRGSGGATAGSDGGFSSGVVSAATDSSASGVRTFTEARLKAVLKLCWDAGGQPDMVMVGSFNKQAASAFDGIATLYRDTGSQMNQASIMGAADVYVSDFGQHKIVPNRFSRARTALVVDSEYWEAAYLQPFRVEKLAKTGHSERRLLCVEYTLCSKNEAASGVVADLSTS